MFIFYRLSISRACLIETYFLSFSKKRGIITQKETLSDIQIVQPKVRNEKTLPSTEYGFPYQYSTSRGFWREQKKSIEKTAAFDQSRSVNEFSQRDIV